MTATHPLGGDDLARRLAALEPVARRLDPESPDRAGLRDAVIRYGEEFLDALPTGPAYQTGDRGLPAAAWAPEEEPRDLAEALDLLRRSIDVPGINPASGRHLGYIPGGGLYASALADYLADVANRYAGVFFASPGAVRLENALIRWLAGVVGFPPSAGGNLTSGGSLANLMAIVTARDAAGLRSADIPGAVVYLSAHAHHCLQKALRIAGLGEVQRREIPVDQAYRIRPDALAQAIAEDRRAGHRPWLVIASAGTTDTGAIDPLDAIADVARDAGLWFHVDGAYGAFFALVPAMRERLRGMERADSLVLDPHKTLFLPYGSGVVLVRNPQHLAASHHYEANYMQDALRQAAELSPADLSVELTKPFRGLRLWLPLHLHGLAAFRAALEEKLLLARHAYRRLQEEGFAVGPEPDLSVVAFRWEPETGDADAFNRRLLDEVVADGRVFLSSTKLDGRFTLRLALVVFRTHRAEVDLAVEILAAAARRLARDAAHAAVTASTT